MKKTAIPNTLPAAQTLLERFGELEGAIGQANAVREATVAAVNAQADALITPLKDEADSIFAALQGWWTKAGPSLLTGQRKSIELGGCTIGTRKQPASLVVAGEEDAVIDVLSALRWAKPFLKRKLSLDKKAVLSAIEGPRGTAFAELGLVRNPGDEVFFVTRAKVQGVRT